MDKTMDLLMAHRTVRRFKTEAVEEALLDRILACGLRAPNTGNMQMYSVVVTREPELKDKLCDLHFGQCRTAPVWLTVCADVYRYHRWCQANGCGEPYGNLLWLLTATVDASLCAQNMMTAAESAGLGGCYLGTVLYQTKAIAELLHCPKGVMPVATIALGWPDEEPRMSERIGPDGVIHNETYHDYSDEDIDRIHRVREELPFNQEMVKQNNVRNLAELFTTLRYPLKDNLAISEALKNFIDINWK